ncbi:MAG: T9SS type A sorting domain-containing protein, partial [candidate division KSB1 bacterium]|nr:T9SS type A sorting domain-containing protein [candidate division KSB1 bacterium]
MKTFKIFIARKIPEAGILLLENHGLGGEIIVKVIQILKLVTTILVFMLILISANKTISQSEWENQTIRATGVGFPNLNMPISAQRAGAIEAAKRSALRNLLEAIKELKLNSGKTIADLMEQDEAIRVRIEETINREFKVIALRELNDGAFEVEIEIALYHLFAALYGPKEYQLFQNYPNPFNSTTTIQYLTWYANPVQITIYNSLGQEIRKLVNKNHPAGENSTTWNGRDENGNLVLSGTYFYTLRV